MLSRATGAPDAESAWWRMRDLLTAVERGFDRLGPVVRARWDGFESGLAREAAIVEAEAERSDAGARAVLLREFVERAVASYLETAEALVREIGACV